MSDQRSSYSQIVRAASLFGGVNVFKIIISIIRSKVIAVLLGPTGMGVSGLLLSTTSLISGLTNFGLGISAVKNVAVVNNEGNKTRISIIIKVLRRWVWITGLLGMILTIVTAPLLSKLTFGNSDYTLSFIWISVSLLLAQLSTGQMVVLQGLRMLKHLAKANLIGSILGLLLTIPLYYYFGIKGIVPAIIFNAVFVLIGSWYYSRKVELEKVNVSVASTLLEGKDMLFMGFMLSLSGLISIGSSYLLRVFISKQGGIEEVGLYTAGFAIINSYAGLVFTAMGTDFYPRLSIVARDYQKTALLTNQQNIVSILFLAPILTIFIVFSQYVLILLYSSKFIPLNNMLQWAALAIYFKAVSWSMAYVLLANGASRVYFWNELLANIYLLAFSVIGYKLAGIDGLGIAYLISYLCYLIQIFVIIKIKYQFSFTFDLIKIFLLQFIFGLFCFFIIKYVSNPFQYFFGAFIILLSVWYSIKEMKKRIDFRKLFIK